MGFGYVFHIIFFIFGDGTTSVLVLIEVEVSFTTTSTWLPCNTTPSVLLGLLGSQQPEDQLPVQCILTVSPNHCRNWIKTHAWHWTKNDVCSYHHCFSQYSLPSCLNSSFTWGYLTWFPRWPVWKKTKLNQLPRACWHHAYSCAMCGFWYPKVMVLILFRPRIGNHINSHTTMAPRSHRCRSTASRGRVTVSSTSTNKGSYCKCFLARGKIPLAISPWGKAWFGTHTRALSLSLYIYI